MAILWEKVQQGRRYQVRSAGQTRRLYTDGVFHSQFNPRRPLTGSVWDLLLLPAFLLPPGAVRRVLVLGVGGGAVIRQLQHFVAPAHITGVELNKLHLQIARRFFGVQGKGVTLVAADAIRWVKDYRGPAFDMIIDDLFGEEDGEPVRAIAADQAWVEGLLRHLTPGGVLVSNFASGRELKASVYWDCAPVRRRLTQGFQLTTPAYENVVSACTATATDSRTLRARLRETPGLNPDLKTSRLRYQIRKL